MAKNENIWKFNDEEWKVHFTDIELLERVKIKFDLEEINSIDTCDTENYLKYRKPKILNKDPYQLEKINGREPNIAIVNQESAVNKKACCKFNFLS